MTHEIDPARLELLRQQKADATTTLRSLFVALTPLRTKSDALLEKLKMADNEWQNASFEAAAAGRRVPARPATIDEIMAEMAEIDRQAVMLEEEKNSHREVVDQLSSLIDACAKFVEKVG